MHSVIYDRDDHEVNDAELQQQLDEALSCLADRRPLPADARQTSSTSATETARSPGGRPTPRSDPDHTEAGPGGLVTPPARPTTALSHRINTEKGYVACSTLSTPAWAV